MLISSDTNCLDFFGRGHGQGHGRDSTPGNVEL